MVTPTSVLAPFLTGLCLVALPVSTQSVQPEPDRGVWRTAAPALTKRTEEGEPVHSFQSLLRHLRTIVKDRMRLKSDAAIEFDKTTTPTPLQQRALDLLGVSLTL